MMKACDIGWKMWTFVIIKQATKQFPQQYYQPLGKISIQTTHDPQAKGTTTETVKK